MDDETHLVQEIVARPEDDLPRLVYADWLEDRGDCRAELIRVQIEIANQGGEIERAKDLRVREQQLLTEFFAQPGFKRLEELGVSGGYVRRGFLEDISINARKLVTHAGELFRIARVLRHLRVWGSAAVINEIAKLRQLSQLLSLELPGDLIYTAGAAALAASPYLNRLQHLNLCGNLIGDEGVQMLADSRNFREVQRLNLNANDLTQAAIACLAESAHLRRIKFLSLRSNRIIGRANEVAARLSNMSNLNELVLVWEPEEPLTSNVPPDQDQRDIGIPFGSAAQRQIDEDAHQLSRRLYSPSDGMSIEEILERARNEVSEQDRRRD